MLTNVLYLETIKQRAAVAAVALVILVCFLLGNGITLITQDKPVEVATAMVVMFLGAGVPLLALILGANAGAGLRGQLSRSSEEMLPFPTVKRVLGAYLISLGYFVLTAGPIVIAAYALHLLADFAGADFAGLNIPVAALLAMTLQLHLLSFLFSYWIGQPFLGAGLALIPSAVAAFFIIMLFRLPGQVDLTYHPYLSRFWVWFASFLVIGSISGLAAVVLLARRIEQEKRLAFFWGLAPALLVCSAILFAYFPICRILTIVGHELSPAPLYGRPIRLDASGRSMAALNQGVILMTQSGTVVRILPDGGRRVILNGTSIQFTDLLSFSYHWFRKSEPDLALDTDQSLWILNQPDRKRNPDVYQVFKQNGSDPAKLISTFSEKESVYLGLIQFGDQMGLHKTEDQGWRYAMVPTSGSKVKWSSNVVNIWTLFTSSGKGTRAVISDDRRTLILSLDNGFQKKWNLPGQALEDNFSGKPYNIIRPVSDKGEESAFVLPVLGDDNKIRLILCYPDGSVRSPWSMAFPPADPHSERAAQNKFDRTPVEGGGMAWAWPFEMPESLFVIGSDGEVFLPLPVRKLFGERYAFDIKGLSGSKLWTIADCHFVKIDLVRGEVEQDFGQIARSRLDWKYSVNPYYNVYGRPTREGIYYIQDGHIRLIDWDGRRHDLGAAWVD